MEYFFGSKGPSHTEIMLQMISEQGKQITGLIQEVKELQVMIAKYVNEDNEEQNSVEVHVPTPFYGELDDFLNGCLLIDDEEE